MKVTYKAVADYLGTTGVSQYLRHSHTIQTAGVLFWSGNVLIGDAYWVYAKPDEMNANSIVP